MNDCGCGSKGPSPNRLQAEYLAQASEGAVLGPNLGGGFSGSWLGSGFGRVGGGVDQHPMTHFPSQSPIDYPQVRHDWSFDYSTPARIFEQPPGSLPRQLGGLL